MTELIFIEARCKGCGFCVEFCPRKALVLSEEMNVLGYHFAKVADIEKCNGCAICAMMCPEVIIEVKEV